MTTTSPLDLAALPKAELHLHIEGTLEPETVLELAERNRVPLPFADEDALRAAYRFADLQDFLDLYYAALATLRTPEDFHTMAARYYARAAAQGVAHAEIFLDPQAHTSRGVPFEAMLEGITAAVDEARGRGITGGVIACILRDRPVADAERMYEQVLAHRESFLGVGLDSAEAPFPPEPFAAVFARARSDGLHRVAHAGEEGPPRFVVAALDALGVERVDHGVRASEDPDLVARLARDRVPLTVCPLSNLALRGVASLAEHPILDLLAAGVLVTVNSDDPAYFGGYVADNFVALRDALGMTDAQAVRLARNSVDASFAGAARQAELRALIDEAAARG